MKGKGGNMVLNSCTHTKTRKESVTHPSHANLIWGYFPLSPSFLFIPLINFGAMEVMEVDDFIGQPFQAPNPWIL
jgi:hypothetical protein